MKPVLTKKSIVIYILPLIFIFSGCENPFQSKEKKNYKIVFEDETSLYSVNTDGSELTKIHDLKGTPFQMSWSPDARKVLIDIYSVYYATLNPDGSEYREFHQNPALPANWRNNEEIVFSYWDSVFTLNIYTEDRRMISRGRIPSSSPNGDKIAVIKNEHELYVLNTDGSQAQKLADSVSNNGLAWSPDGKQITFIRDRSLWKVFLKNKEEVKLSPEEYWVLGNSSWSPDSKMILGTVREENAIDMSFIVDQKGGSFKLLSEDIKAPQWFPRSGSSQILYISESEKKIMKAKTDGTGAAPIVSLSHLGFYNFAISPKPLP